MPGRKGEPHHPIIGGFMLEKGQKKSRIGPRLKEKGPCFDFHARCARSEPKRILAAHGKGN